MSWNIQGFMTTKEQAVRDITDVPVPVQPPDVDVSNQVAAAKHAALMLVSGIQSSAQSSALRVSMSGHKHTGNDSADFISVTVYGK